jgi:hypothetical protein
VEAFGFWLSVAGAGVSMAAAVWLLVGFRPDNPRYHEGSAAALRRTEFPGLRNLLRDQQKAAALVAIGATLQFVGVVLGGCD